MCPSFDTYARLCPVLKYELTRAPGLCAAAAAIEAAMPGTVVMSRPGAVRTATSGACSPEPNVFKVRWFAS